MRFLLFLLVLLFIAGCDGPVGAIDTENGVTAEITSGGLAVTNDRDEPIHVVAYGEWAMIYVDIAPQTTENPGRFVGVGDRVTLPFSDSGLLRRSDSRYRVSWVTLKGPEDERYLGARGELELQR
ncbi:MAG: hypothetical protein AAFQ43_12915 [Bacteroidota bacterium]